MLSGGVFEYAAINPRARAMYFTLLTAQEWIELVNATDYNALIGLLRRTIYGSCLMQVDEKDLDPRQTVFQLNRQMADVMSLSSNRRPNIPVHC